MTQVETLAERAPCSDSHTTSSRAPLRFAASNGVSPSCLTQFKSAPRSRRYCAAGNTQDKLETAVVSAARQAAQKEGVGSRKEETSIGNYSKARPQSERVNQPVVQTALATANFFRKPGSPEIVLADVGSTDANNAVGMGIPAVAVGAVMEHLPHRLKEFAEASSIVPGIKSLFALAVSTTTH